MQEVSRRHRLTPKERQRLLEDDVPLSMKRKAEGMTEELAEETVKRLRSSFCATVATYATYGQLHNEWVSRYEIDLPRKLTGLPVVSARIHRKPAEKAVSASQEDVEQVETLYPAGRGSRKRLHCQRGSTGSEVSSKTTGMAGYDGKRQRRGRLRMSMRNCRPDSALVL